jgi:hypothetical protein
MSAFSKSGDGWFEENLGVSATDIVSRLRKARRHNKDDKQDIDALIQDVRMLKSMEVEMTLKNIDWASDYIEEIRNFDLSDKTLKSLRKFSDTRKVNLVKACIMWRDAENALEILKEHEEVWGSEEKKAWVNAMNMKKSKPFHGYNPKRHHRKGGLNAAGRAKFKRETGANLKPPVTTKPSKLKPGSKRAKRRKSFCARMSGSKGPTSKDGKLTPKGAALKRWNC